MKSTENLKIIKEKFFLNRNIDESLKEAYELGKIDGKIEHLEKEILKLKKREE